MKKNISIVLVLILLIGTMSVSMAKTNSEEKLQAIIYVEKDENGKYVLGEKSNNNKAKMCKEYGIYELENGIFISYTGTAAYQQVEKITFSLIDTNEVEEVLQNYNVPDEVKEKIELSSIEAVEANDEDAAMTLVIPYEPMIRGSYSVNYTYNGKSMKDVFIYSFGKNTGYKTIKSGAQTKALTNVTSSVVVTGLGLINTPLAITAGAISLLQAWASAVGDLNFSGSSEDFAQILFNYDVSTKYTYADIGSGWQLGLVSENVYVNYIKTVQYYAYSSYNQSYYYHMNINKTVTSPNFNNSAPVALQYILTPRNEELKTKVGDYTLSY